MFPGESASTAAGFGTGMPLDVTPGCPALAVAADAAVGGRYRWTTPAGRSYHTEPTRYPI